jgi:hypothetical protein
VLYEAGISAYDFSDYSELALHKGLSFAQEYQSELHLLHVLPPNLTVHPDKHNHA